MWLLVAVVFFILAWSNGDLNCAIIGALFVIAYEISELTSKLQKKG